MRRPPLPLLASLLLGALLAAPALAGSPAASLTWESAESLEAETALLLVLERGPEGWSLLDARTAAVRAKVRRVAAEDSGPVFALVDDQDRPLSAGRLEVRTSLHGPELDESGEMRCVSVPLERVTLAVRLPMVPGAARLRLFEAADFAPTSGSALALALQARPADAGLRELASLELGALGEAKR